MLLPDDRRRQGEVRFHALGETDDGQPLHITITLRAAGTVIRVISARHMHRKERMIYSQAKQDAAWARDRSRGARILGGDYRRT
ncbi:MAG: BrnT family toxin [Thiocapsa sp.]|nr:BrnT family toxin [Thiocapsa sp.]